MLKALFQKTVPSRSLALYSAARESRTMLSVEPLSSCIGSSKSLNPSSSGKALTLIFPRHQHWPSHSQIRSIVAFAATSKDLTQSLGQGTSSVQAASRQDKEEAHKGPSKAKRARKAEPGLRQGQSSRQKTALTPEQQIYNKLIVIPGVGPANAELFAKAGYTSVEAVLKTFQTTCSLNADHFREHLRDTVGIKHAGFIQRIVEYCEKSSNNSFCTLSVEGNISAGKSTFLDSISAHCPDLQDLLHVAPEPVTQWQNVAGNGHNILEAFYADKKRFAYTFQNYIFLTRFMQEQESAAEMKGHPYRLLERSVWCDRMVFVESLKQDGLLTEMELSIYHSWFDPLVERNPCLIPDGFIYLRAAPDTCMNRLKGRNRGEETGIQIEYLEDLHQKHDNWLYNIHATSREGLAEEMRQARNAWYHRLPHLTTQQIPELSRLPSWRNTASYEKQAEFVRQTIEAIEPKIPEAIVNDVKMLNRSHNQDIPSALQHLPALVLDCDKDIRDVDAQREHANKVNQFFQYVKEMRQHKRFVKMLREGEKVSGSDRSVDTFLRHIMRNPYQEEQSSRELIFARS